MRMVPVTHTSVAHLVLHCVSLWAAAWDLLLPPVIFCSSISPPLQDEKEGWRVSMWNRGLVKEILALWFWRQFISRSSLSCPRKFHRGTVYWIPSNEGCPYSLSVYHLAKKPTEPASVELKIPEVTPFFTLESSIFAKMKKINKIQLVSSDGKESAEIQETWRFNTWGWEDPWKRIMAYSILPEKPHGERNWWAIQSRGS